MREISENEALFRAWWEKDAEHRAFADLAGVRHYPIALAAWDAGRKYEAQYGPAAQELLRAIFNLDAKSGPAATEAPSDEAPSTYAP